MYRHRNEHLIHPAKPLYRNELNLDKTIIYWNDASEKEDYHMVTRANRQLLRQSAKFTKSPLLKRHNRMLSRPEYINFDNKTS